jgi:DNA-binding MarR family transcriptional regulator
MDFTHTVPFETTARVRDTCLCLHTQRAARILARRFDAALKPTGLTNEQFSLLMALNRPNPASMNELAYLLGADRTTLTAALKPLIRQGMAETRTDDNDRRVRRVALTAEGRSRLWDALDIWSRAHGAVEAELEGANFDHLRSDLRQLSGLISSPVVSPAGGTQ